MPKVKNDSTQHPAPSNPAPSNPLPYFAHSGICRRSISNKPPSSIIPAVSTIMPRIFIINPTLTISGILILLVPNIIAFGGVAIGIINAKELANVAGTIRSSGFLPIAVPSAAITGRIISDTPVLDVNSVRNVSIVQVKPIISRSLTRFQPSGYQQYNVNN